MFKLFDIDFNYTGYKGDYLLMKKNIFLFLTLILATALFIGYNELDHSKKIGGTSLILFKIP